MSQVCMPSNQLQTAVLFLVFNRPDKTKEVFEAIRQAKPARLYIAADGPRCDKIGEVEKTKEVRRIATSVDWTCSVKTLFRDKNLGCKQAISSGIDWFFINEDQGIILEDDCLPHQDFFKFCDLMLNYYADDEGIWVVTGNNFQNNQIRGGGSYYFSRYNHVWGWATWRRAWSKRDMAIGFWPQWKQSVEWQNYISDKAERKYWERIFDKAYRNEIDTWDYPWTANVWYNRGLTITPNVNLVSNIGFGHDATFTKSADSPLADMLTYSLHEIIHPTLVAQDHIADLYVFHNTFGGKTSLLRRLLNYFYRKLKGI